VEENVGLSVGAAWIAGQDRSMWRTLRPSAGQAQQWVSEWVCTSYRLRYSASKKGVTLKLGVEVVQESRSLKMVPFHRSWYTTFYWSAILVPFLTCYLTLNNIVTLKYGLEVIQTGTIRKLGCGCLFAFHSDMALSCISSEIKVKKVKVWTLAPTYMSQIRDQQPFIISEMAADWHEPMVPIKADIGRKSWFFHTPLHSTPR